MEAFIGNTLALLRLLKESNWLSPARFAILLLFAGAFVCIGLAYSAEQRHADRWGETIGKGIWNQEDGDFLMASAYLQNSKQNTIHKFVSLLTVAGFCALAGTVLLPFDPTIGPPIRAAISKAAQLS